MDFKKLLTASGIALSFAVAGCEEAKKVEEKVEEVAKEVKEEIKKDAAIVEQKAEQVEHKVEDTLKEAVKEVEQTIKTAEDKTTVDSKVRKIDGVRSINNQIVVQDERTSNQDRSVSKSDKEFTQDTFATSNDQQLNKTIRDKISSGWFYNSNKNVQLSTNNGIVTLEGRVNSRSDAQKIVNEIQNINGVRTVVDRLQVSEYTNN